jgi:spore coat protein H
MLLMLSVSGQSISGICITLSEPSLAVRPAKFIEAVVTMENRSFFPTGLRLKGNGSFQSIDSKPSITLKFDWQEPLQGRFDWPKIHLNNSAQDSSYLKPFIASELFQATGYPTPQVKFARVQLNERDLGLYVITEGTTRKFLKRHFVNSSGNLYEGIRDVDQKMDIDGGDRTSDFSDLRLLVTAARNPDMNLRLKAMESILDLDRFYTFMAIETFTGHWDGYCNNPGNYRIYRDPSTGKFTFIPHGMDMLFQSPESPVLFPMKGLVAQGVLETREGRRKYLERLLTIVSQVNPDKLEKQTREVRDAMRPILEERGEFAKADFAARHLHLNIRRRVTSVRKQLDALLKEDFPALFIFETNGTLPKVTKELSGPSSIRP